MPSRLLLELKVAELRKELENRGKDKTGVKQVLLDRLKEVLVEEGHDPLMFRFGSEGEQKQEAHGTTCVVDEYVDPEKGAIDLCKDTTESCVTVSEITEDLASQKKIADESVPYVVQVGDQEEDLDYDLKNDAVEHPEMTRSNAQDNVAHATPFADSRESVKDSSAADKLNEDNHRDTPERRNIWVSNLPKTIKAADLKEHFSKAGKVVSATVVTRTRSPGGCFGFLQMCSAEEAKNAANQLNGAEIEGCKITVEATERKPLSLPSKKLINTAPGSHAAYQAPVRKFTYRRPLAGRLINQRQFVDRKLTRTSSRPVVARNLGQERGFPMGTRKRPGDIPLPLRLVQRPKPGNLVHQYVKRASHFLNLSRAGIKRTEQSLIVAESTPRFRKELPRQNLRYSKPHDESSCIKRFSPRSTIPFRRFEDKLHTRDKRQFTIPSNDRVRPANNPRVMFPPKRNDQHMRVGQNPPQRIPRQNAQTQGYQGRSSQMSKDYDSYSRTVRNYPSVIDSKRPLPFRPSANRFYDRDERPRTISNGIVRGGSTNRSPYRYKSYSERPPEARSSPGSRAYPTTKPAVMCDVRREYRAVSRSPPRSRSTFGRPYPETTPDNRAFKHIPRDRSPIGYSSSSSNVRPKVVDYGHRSEPRGSWSSWRMDQDSRHVSPPAGHTWKPAGQAYPVSNYPRGPYRYS